MAAVTTVYEISGRDSEKRVEDRRYRRSFYVSLDSVAGGPAAAEVAVGVNGQSIPLVGSAHPNVPTATVLSVRPDPVDGFFTDFIVTVEYSTDAPSADEDQLPTERPWDIAWDSVIESMAIDAEISSNPAVNGSPITNSAGQPFDPPYEIATYSAILRVVRNEVAFSVTTAKLYTGKLNSDSFLGSDPLTCKCTKIAGRRFFEQNAYWWEVTYEFVFKDDRTLYQGVTPVFFSGHSLIALDNGLMQLDGGGNLVPCLDSEGNQVTQPVLLDGAGGQEPSSPNPNPFYKVFEVAKAVPFSPLGLSGI